MWQQRPLLCYRNGRNSKIKIKNRRERANGPTTQRSDPPLTLNTVRSLAATRTTLPKPSSDINLVNESQPDDEHLAAHAPKAKQGKEKDSGFPFKVKWKAQIRFNSVIEPVLFWKNLFCLKVVREKSEQSNRGAFDYFMR
ncbi:hypothetical protein OUZ56_015758 [Daphnia magna]|uniref:Uncharacterized protein n=1 Tax=Daphnia magna TaxID=35525 RepID=A0ABR0ANR6_9CRUS|nr:hypothetical protein OUZ56_015758 [Daphnia magna]